MRTGTWLAIRELRARGGRAILAATLVAVAAALGSGLELVARGREEAASARIDGLGPALRVVPAAVGGSELARLDLGPGLLPPTTVSRIAEVLGSDLRQARSRLVFQRVVSGRTVPVIGAQEVPPGRVLVGAALAEALGHPQEIDLGGGAWPVERVQDATGTAEDGAVVLALSAAQALAGLQGINEVQIYLRAGAPPSAAGSRLQAASLHARVVQGARGAPADEEVQGALSKGRHLAQGVLALLVGCGLAVMAYLDAAERRTEVATLRAVGAGAGTIWWTLVARSLAVGLAGGITGAFGGVALAGLMEQGAMPEGTVALATLALTGTGSALLGALAAGPVALALARRDPVPWLQEG